MYWRRAWPSIAPMPVTSPASISNRKNRQGLPWSPATCCVVSVSTAPWPAFRSVRPPRTSGRCCTAGTPSTRLPSPTIRPWIASTKRRFAVVWPKPRRIRCWWMVALAGWKNSAASNWAKPGLPNVPPLPPCPSATCGSTPSSATRMSCRPHWRKNMSPQSR